LEAAGYAATAFDLCAAGVGAPHIRQRLFWMANSDDARPQGRGERRDGAPQQPPSPCGLGHQERRPADGFWEAADWLRCRDAKWRSVEPGTFPLADGVPARVGKLRAYGNAIVAPLAQAFIEACMTC
jgi:DNA (cytosine-5)-methyltransferase 1